MSFLSDLTTGMNKAVNQAGAAQAGTQFQNMAPYQQANAGVTNQLANQGNLQNQLSGQVGNQIGLQNQLNAQGGLANQSNVFNQQQALANQLQAQAQGGGPNPAQAMLAQNTGANVANQAALMAGQRGAGANPALLARQAAQQGAATQQQGVGQAATLQAQQQLGAEQALQNQQQSMGSLANAQVGQQLQNQQNLSAQQQGLGQGLAQSQLANQAAQLGAIGQQNATQASIQNTLQQGQNAMNQQGTQTAGQIAGSVLGAIPGIGQIISSTSGKPSGGGGNIADNSGLGGLASLAMFAAKGGEVPNPKLGAVASQDRFPSSALMPPHLQQMATLYHGNSYNTPQFQPQQKMAEGGYMNVGGQLKAGGSVPGQAKVAGDSETNDTVDAKLSPGEVVIPRSVMQSEDPASAAAQFVAGLQKKKGSGKPESDFKEALQRAVAGRKKK